MLCQMCINECKSKCGLCRCVWLTASYVKGTVYVDPETGEVTYKPGVMDQVNGTAYGYFNNTLSETGWSVLEIQTKQGGAAVNNQLMFAAGYLEGVLTAQYVPPPPFYGHYTGRPALAGTSS